MRSRSASEVSQKMITLLGDRDMLMRMMMMAGPHNPLQMLMQQSNEEERALQRAIEESRSQGPPNPDNMSYEQLMELGDRVGKVSKGLTK